MSRDKIIKDALEVLNRFDSKIDTILSTMENNAPSIREGERLYSNSSIFQKTEKEKRRKRNATSLR